MSLFKPEKPSRERSRAFAALDATSSESKLAKTAIWAPDSELRRAALDKMTDQHLIIEVIESPHLVDDFTRLHALGRLTDKTIAVAHYERIAQEASHCDLRVAAYRWLGKHEHADMETMLGYSMPVTNRSHCQSVVKETMQRISNRALLERIQREATELYVQQCARSRIAETERQAYLTMVSELTDQEKLVSILRDADECSDIRLVAAKGIQDMRHICEAAIAANQDYRFPKEAIELVVDKAMLTDIAEQALMVELRHQATLCLSKLKALARSSRSNTYVL